MINECTIAEAKNAVKNGICGYLMKDGAGNYVMREINRLPFYLEGAPGVGKTEIVSQVAKELGIGFVSFSLTHHTRNSLLGLPVIMEMDEGDTSGGKYTSYTMSEVLAKVYEEVQAGRQEGILLLDEFPCMSPTIMPAMLAFLQTKNIGMHVLPEGWIIVLCGNPPAFNDHSVKFDAAIRDRIRTIQVRWDEQTFISYAKGQGYHDMVVDFLELYPQKIYRCNEEELVTCRGWENFSHALKLYEKMGTEVEYHMIRQFIKSDEVALSFQRYYRDNLGLKKEDIHAIIQGERLDELAEKYDIQNGNIKMNLLQIIEEHMVRMTGGVQKEVQEDKFFRKFFRKVKKSAIKEKHMPLELLIQCLDHPEIAREIHGDLMEDLDALEAGENGGKKEVLEEIRNSLRAQLNSETGRRYRNYKDAEKQADFFNIFLKSRNKKRNHMKKSIAEMADHVFLFLSKLQDSSIYQERFFRFINQQPDFMLALADQECSGYLEMCGKVFSA